MYSWLHLLIHLLLGLTIILGSQYGLSDDLCARAQHYANHLIYQYVPLKKPVSTQYNSLLFRGGALYMADAVCMLTMQVSSPVCSCYSWFLIPPRAWHGAGPHRITKWSSFEAALLLGYWDPAAPCWSWWRDLHSGTWWRHTEGSPRSSELFVMPSSSMVPLLSPLATNQAL